MVTVAATGSSVEPGTRGAMSVVKGDTPTRVVCVVLLVLIGMRTSVHYGLTAGTLASMLFLPIWVSKFRLFRTARLFVGVVLLCMVWSYALTSIAVSDGYTVNASDRIQSLTLFLSIVVGTGTIFWARTVMSIELVGFSYGLGMVIGAAMSGPVAGGNPWKFVWAAPVSVVVLALAGRRHTTASGVVALLGLAVVSVILDCRSYSAALALSAVLLLWNARPKSMTRRGWWVMTAAAIAGVGLAMYYLATTLLVAGYLGKSAQDRTVAQIQTSGSLLLGGRPEVSATWALMQYRPQGYGVGIIPTPSDILVAKSGLAGIGYNPNNGYVERFMLGGHIELHSIFGDLWATAGFAGLALVVLIAFIVIRGLSTSIASGTASALPIFLCCWTFWNLAFSPLYAALPILILAIGVILPRKVATLSAPKY